MRIEGKPLAVRTFRSDDMPVLAAVYRAAPDIGVIVVKRFGRKSQPDKLWLTVHGAGDFVLASETLSGPMGVEFRVYGANDPVPVLSAIAAHWRCTFAETSAT